VCSKQSPGHVDVLPEWPDDQMNGSNILRILGLAAILLFLLASFSPLPNALNDWAAMPAQIEPAEAIVVLGAGLSGPGILGDVSMRRTLYGITLYHQGLAPLLVFSGPAYGKNVGEAGVRADMAHLFGVPDAAIVTEATAQTTREEAGRIAALLQPRGVQRILLVTSAEHMRRSQRLFELAGFRVLPAPVDDLTHALTPEARLRLMRQVTQEFLARLYYRVAGYL
jgi:uncharacterized SAM-binding protein YcdF (DUF218 family)